MTALYLLIAFLIGMLVGGMANAHANKKNLDYGDYIRCVEKVIHLYDGEQQEMLLRELSMYACDPLTNMHELSGELEGVIRTITDDWP